MSKILHVVAGLAERDGGPFYSVPRLSSALNEDGSVSRVFSTKNSNKKNIDYYFFDRTVKFFDTNRSILPILRSSSSLLKCLSRADFDDAVCHVHGLWLMPNVYPARIKKQRPSRVLVHSPRGMLSPAALAISPWKKKIAWSLWQESALNLADCIHVTARSEYDEVRALGIRAPVAIIPNGVDIPSSVKNIKVSIHQPRMILCLGRIHPKKNLKNLIQAWASLEKRYPNWLLRIVGPAEVGYDVELAKFANSMGLQHLSIEAPVFGAEKIQLLHEADLFVLPTLNENFGMVVAEALSAGVPVISTKGAPWHGLVEENCGWWIDHGVEPLINALDVAMNTNSLILTEMGSRGRVWMERDFNWKNLAREMRSVYEWLQYGGDTPSCVVID